MNYTCIIPSTGRTTLRDRALHSVFHQTKPFNEIFVIYDLQKDPSIVHSEDVEIMFTGGTAGGPAARKQAYAKATGDYVIFLDDDDALSHTFLDHLDLFLHQLFELPSLVLPRVQKIWPEGLIPSLSLMRLPFRKSNYRAVDLSQNDWLPITSSGLILSRQTFSTLPVSCNIKGFNDLQICFAAKKASVPIFYCDDCMVKFYQYFSINRLTSDFSSRVENLNVAVKYGLEFSETKKYEILKSSALSQARSVAYRDGLRASILDLRRSQAILSTPLVETLSIRFVCNIIIIIWLSITRHFS